MPRTVPEVLKECHRLRRHLRELQSELDLGPRVLKVQQTAVATAEAANKAAHDEVKRLKLKLKDDELSLKQTETRLSKLQADVNTAGSKKEYDLKNTEIATATALKSDLEDAILGGMTAVEEATAALPVADADWAAAQARYADQRATAADRLVRLKADQIATHDRLTAVEPELPADVRQQYNRMVKLNGADALAGVTGLACGHCRTSITQQDRTTLVSGGFLCCSQCGRGLYLADG